ncbi:MAG: winged helix-turn-helix transcriptional regulator [Rhodospirillales bacterium]|nr:winged helix-turn-helix transcriptional regulator [Rhodospirillales bacterium]
MRSNVARKQQEPKSASSPTKSASSPTSRPYHIEEQVGYLLRRAHQRASAIFQVSIGDPNITPTKYSSMVKLNEYKELSQNLLGRLVGMDKATMQGVVRRLKERGLVDSRPDPGDARRTLLSLTTEGQRLVNKLLINGPAVSRETMKPLTAQEQRQLLDLLSKIV